jgi:hypothetical protein
MDFFLAGKGFAVKKGAPTHFPVAAYKRGVQRFRSCMFDLLSFPLFVYLRNSHVSSSVRQFPSFVVAHLAKGEE